MTKACVIGWPVEHARSPLIHNHWIKAYGLSGFYGREAVEPAVVEHRGSNGEEHPDVRRQLRQHRERQDHQTPEGVVDPRPAGEPDQDRVRQVPREEPGEHDRPALHDGTRGGSEHASSLSARLGSRFVPPAKPVSGSSPTRSRYTEIAVVHPHPR